jgi:putative SOS response-associated peptidase YedK
MNGGQRQLGAYFIFARRSHGPENPSAPTRPPFHDYCGQASGRWLLCRNQLAGWSPQGKVRTSKFWRPSFEQRRCLVPASSYCEPNGQRPATWYWFALKGDDERPLFAFPGIWQRWAGPVKKDGPPVSIETYAFMTTEPNVLTRSIHHERMPVLLSGEDQFETWLSGSPAEAFALAKSLDPALMRIVQSGKTKEDLLAA